MRSISAGLLNAQRAATGSPLVIVGLTKSGQSGYNYQTNENDSGRIFAITHTEGAYSGGAIIRLKNHDLELRLIDFRGYRVSVGWGFFGPDEVSTSAPMFVWSQRNTSEEGELLVELVCIDEWERIARAIIRGESGSWGDRPGWSGTSVKDILGQLFGDLGIGWHPDEPDSQANNYQPEFNVDLNSSARAIIRQLLGMTECSIRMRTDGAHLIHPTDGAIDYEYDSVHAFYSDIREQSAPSYNSVIVQNREPTPEEATEPAGTTFYQGSYADAASVSKFGSLHQIVIMDWVQSDTVCATLAEMLVKRAIAEASQGNIIVPMNVAQEIYDKVKVVDTRANQEVIGRVGELTRVYGAGEYRVEIRLGGVSTAAIIASIPPLPSDILGITPWPTFWPTSGIPMGGIGRWIQPIAVDIEFSSPAWNIVNWTSGYIRFADGGSQSIVAGSYTFSTYNQRMYLYFRLGYNTLFATSNFATAACGNDRAIVAIIRSGADAYQRAMIVTFRGMEPYLNSAAIAEGAVTSALLKKTAQPFNCSVTFSPADWNGVNWSPGNIAFADGTTYGINAGSLTGIPATSTRYIYYTLNNLTLSTTDNYVTAITGDNVLLCIVTTGSYYPGAKPVILPMTSKGLTVNAVAIAANVITTDMLQALCIVSSKIAADQILAGHINVATLDAISANLGLINAGEIRLGTGALGNFTGWRLWAEGGFGLMAGYVSGSMKWWTQSDGSFHWAGDRTYVQSDGGLFTDSPYIVGTIGNLYSNITISPGLNLIIDADNIKVDAYTMRLLTGTVFVQPGTYLGPYSNESLGATVWWRTRDIGGGNKRDHKFRPIDENWGFLGDSYKWWWSVYATNVRYKSISSFQEHDDIKLIRGMKPYKKDKHLIDLSTIPDEMKAKDKEGKIEEFIDAGASFGILFGAIQQLADRVEKLEEK